MQREGNKLCHTIVFNEPAEAESGNGVDTEGPVSGDEKEGTEIQRVVELDGGW